jgi:hypothetical protein
VTATLVACGGGSGSGSEFACGNSSGVYVSTSGSNNGDGTRDEPLQTLQMAASCSLSSQTIKVAAGAYTVSDDAPLTVTDGRWFLGGYAPDFSTRDIASYTSTILGESAWNDAGSNPVLISNSNGTRATRLDGFTLQGATEGIAGQAITLTASGNTVINNNTIIGGGNTNMESYAISILSGVLIENNTLVAGAGPTNRGIFLWTESDSRHTVESNTLEGFEPDEAISLSGTGGSVTFTGNRIDGSVYLSVFALTFERNIVRGKVTLTNETILPDGYGPFRVRNNIFEVNSATAASGAGVEIGSTTGSQIQNNTIVEAADSTLPTRGLHISGTNAVVSNNIISVLNNCLSADTTPNEIKNNDLSGCPLLYSENSEPLPGNSLTLIDDVNNLSGIQSSGNIAVDPALDNTSDYRLSALSPINVVEGGLDLSIAFDYDADNNSRTVPWSMGAFEYDP